MNLSIIRLSGTTWNVKKLWLQWKMSEKRFQKYEWHKEYKWLGRLGGLREVYRGSRGYYCFGDWFNVERMNANLNWLVIGVILDMNGVVWQWMQGVRRQLHMSISNDIVIIIRLIVLYIQHISHITCPFYQVTISYFNPLHPFACLPPNGNKWIAIFDFISLFSYCVNASC